jgi:lactoylglutathione lyase
MKFHHAAVWVADLEKIKEYYIRHFGAKSNQLYENKSTGFKSYFLSFGSGARLEIMYRTDIPENTNDIVGKQHKGLIHLAFLVDSEEEVNKKAEE